MEKDIIILLDEIIQSAKKQGMDQKTLALKAQVDPSSLSRAKKNKDIKFSTLQSLANTVGLSLILAPNSSLAEDVIKGKLFDD